MHELSQNSTGEERKNTFKELINSVTGALTVYFANKVIFSGQKMVTYLEKLDLQTIHINVNKHEASLLLNTILRYLEVSEARIIEELSEPNTLIPTRHIDDNLSLQYQKQQLQNQWTQYERQKVLLFLKQLQAILNNNRLDTSKKLDEIFNFLFTTAHESSESNKLVVIESKIILGNYLPGYTHEQIEEMKRVKVKFLVFK
jgi:hypothetical protein